MLLKALATVEALAAALPPRWTTEPQAYFMADDGFSAPVIATPAGYSMQLDEVGVARRITLLDKSGVEAAQGRVVIVDGAAIYDRIAVHADHRRRRLGSVVMGALGEAAQSNGAQRGLLNATAEGYRLYSALGWRLISPYATALIRP